MFNVFVAVVCVCFCLFVCFCVFVSVCVSFFFLPSAALEFLLVAAGTVVDRLVGWDWAAYGKRRWEGGLEIPGGSMELRVAGLSPPLC